MDLLGKHTHHNDNMMVLKRRMGKNGPRKALKNTLASIANEATGGKTVRCVAICIAEM